MRGTRNPNATLCHSEHREESRLERPRRSSLRPRVVSRRSSEQGERKSGCPSEASYLIFRPASVAKACEAHEALTFWLLLGQAKSDRKEILRFALNDNLMVNCQWLIVMRGTRRIMYPENNH
ncbi:hypothetical protein [Tannerella forsythia]|uniref:hypothetical protein n=1 Tax=Tannerella forsythia TaxID=28112 RepID=UPI00242AAC85|nr:hypothetical protein [Tannerella forsythia]